MSSNIQIFNEDSLQALKAMRDKQFDLAIVDPPYGIDVANDARFGIQTKKAATARKDYTKKDWDLGVPTDEYWEQLFRISKNQIVWGVNYFYSDKLVGGRIVWDKDVPDGYSKSKCELAYKSFGVGVDYIKVTWHGMLQYNMKDKEDRIHPTQKPILLYKQLLAKYAKNGDKIIDTHFGSGSIAIACYDMGFDLTAYEIDKEYFDAACKRLDNHKKQLTLW